MSAIPLRLTANHSDSNHHNEYSPAAAEQRRAVRGPIELAARDDDHPYIDRCVPMKYAIRIFGLYPGSTSRPWTNSYGQFRSNRVALVFLLFSSYFWRAYAIFLLSFTAYLFYYTINIWQIYSKQQGYLDILVVCSIITGMKPMIAMASVACYLIGHKRHLKMSNRLNRALHEMNHVHGFPFNMKRFNWAFIGAVALWIVLTYSVAIAEFYVCNHGMLGDWPGGYAVFLAPFITTQDMVPLMYYLVCTYVVLRYTQLLGRQLRRRAQRRAHVALADAYDQLKSLCKLQAAMSKFFGPWQLFSLGWTLVIVSFMCYLATQPHIDLYKFPDHLAPAMDDPEIAKIIKNIINFNITWTVIQIVTAISHLILIIAMGIKINETTRQLINQTLTQFAHEPHLEGDPNLLLLTKFVRKIATQSRWGMHAWQVFDFERPIIFTMVSGVMTYTLFLYRMSNEQQKELVHLNVTKVVNATLL